MQIDRISCRRSHAIATIIIVTLVLFTGGAFASSILSEGASVSQGTDSSLANTEWQLVSYDSGNTTVPVLAGSNVTLEFNGDGSITGSGGINHLFGTYTQSGNTITFGPVGSTLMAGPEPEMAQESTYFSLLGSVSTFKRTGDNLAMSNATGCIVLRFTTDTTTNTGSVTGKDLRTVLPGTEWRLSSYSDGTTVVSGQDINTITLKFDDSGNISGFGGVNRYSGTWQPDGNAISIGHLTSTEMAGPEPLMTLEVTYFNMLGSVTGVSLVDDSLCLTGNDGTIVLTFNPKTVVSEGRYRKFLPAGTSNTRITSGAGGQSLTTITGRFHIARNWSSPASGSLAKPGQAGNIMVTIPTTGVNQRPSTMPRYSNSIIPPKTYPGGPFY